MSKAESGVRGLELMPPSFVLCTSCFDVFSKDKAQSSKYKRNTFARQTNYFLPCAIFSASGKPRRRSIEITPNNGPGARIMNAYRQPTTFSTTEISSIETMVNKNPMHV